MEETRLKLQKMLEDLLGSRNVYFQPPESVKIKYPCIVYSRDYLSTKHADNIPYNNKCRYQMTLIDKNPDSKYLDKLNSLPMCSFERHFTADNLNHDVYNIYY